MSERPEDSLLDLYDRALAEHGDTPRGALWPNAEDLRTRHDVMLDVIVERAGQRVLLCDLGCGTGALLARIRERGLKHIDYVGIDRSAKALEIARAKFPDARFLELDVTSPGVDLSALDCDYLVANGLFTVRHTATEEEMRSFLGAVLATAWPRVRRGVAFNVMSKVVDWERPDLFHASMDDMARLLHGLAGRRVRVRADYGLYEFTCYAWRGDPAQANAAQAPRAARTIPIMRPRLPTAGQLLPYLERIDAARVYTNFGPLVLELEARLATYFGLPTGAAVTASTGTSALIAAILAHAGEADRQRPLALMPSFTFVATAVAAERCGYVPHLADVDPDCWMLDPERLSAHPELARIGVVIPVSAFGRPVPQAPWRRFSERTGIPVVIDAAAAFEAISARPGECIGPIPVVMSLHATKSFATGEGGCVLGTDAALNAAIGRALNFGFHYSRDSRGPSINGKLSEYHAAVGLAELDGWEAKAESFRAVAAAYRDKAQAAGLGDRLVTAPEICSSYVLFRCKDVNEMQCIEQGLGKHGVEFRRWYGAGLDQQSHFADVPADALPVGRQLAATLLGLPMATDLGEPDIDQVIEGLLAGLAAAAA